jgi:hypothetical protein
MIIIQAYKGKHELTQSQKDVLYKKACELKAQGYSHMFVSVHTLPFTDTPVCEYTAIDGTYSQRAFVGKRGGLTNGIGKHTKSGYKLEVGNNLEMVLPNIDKFEHVVTV